MVTKLFKTHKFLYTKDDGLIVVKAQQVYHRVEDLQPITPITPTFMSAVIADDPAIIPEVGAYMRHVQVCSENPYNSTGQSISKAYLPYKSGTTQLPQHIGEINAVPWVERLTYSGESLKL